MASAIATTADEHIVDHFRLKSGSNKGNRRIWIEGARLLRTGLTRGTKLSRLTDKSATYLIVDQDKAYTDMSGRHTVAGTDTRPIIDLCGKWVTDFVGSATHVDIVIRIRSDVKYIYIYPLKEGGAK